MYQLNTHSYKRDHSQDGRRQDKHRRFDTAGIQADAKHVHQGNTRHQAEIPANINEVNNQVPKVSFPSTDIRSSNREFRQNESSQDRGRQYGGPTFQGGASLQSKSSDQAAQSKTQNEGELPDIKGNWRCKICKVWNVGCS